MEYKPWSLLILAFFHFIEPLSKLTFYGMYFQVNPIDAAIIEYQAGTPLQVFEYFFLFPIAGIAIFAVKKWSVPVFLTVEAWVIMTNIPYFNELYLSNQVWLLGFFILFSVLNITVVTYLLLPAVRIAYLNPRIRWWEAMPRYSTNIDVMTDNKIIGKIKNISKSGVFISSHESLPIDSEIELDFAFKLPSKELHIKTPSIILHKFNINGTEGYGTQFKDASVSTKHNIYTLIRHLEHSNADRRPPRRNISDLINWFTTLVRTGRGLYPKTY